MNAYFFNAPDSSNSNVYTIWKSWILTETVEEKCFYWHNPSHSAWPWRWRANFFEQTERESHSEVCMCGVSTQQWASTQITLFDSERTHQSAWLDAVTTPLDKKRVNSCELNWRCFYYFVKNSLVVLLEALYAVFKRIFFWGRLATTKFDQNPQKCSFRRAANIIFSKFLNLSRQKLNKNLEELQEIQSSFDIWWYWLSQE